MGDVVDLQLPGPVPDPTGPGPITHPGIYPDVPLEEYVADPVASGSLSASGAKLLLPPGCPAKFRWWADHPEKRLPKAHFEFGTAVHTMVTGVGPAHITVTARNKDDEPVTDWRTNDAKDEAAAIRAAGGIPLLLKDAERVTAAVDALWAHKRARQLFDCPGVPEATMVWLDPATGVWCRARPDRLPEVGAGRLIVPDLKTCDSADPASCAKAVWAYGYHRQGVTVIDGLAALDVADDAGFLCVFVETTPPYVVTVVEPDWEELEVGRDQMREARALFAGCRESGEWPGYAGEDDVVRVSMPRWARYELEQ